LSQSSPLATEHGDEKFQKYIGYSLIFHGLVVLLFTARALVFPSDDIILHPSIRVDIVDLPDKLTPQVKIAEAPQPLTEQAPAPVPPKPVPEVKKVEVPKKVVSKQKEISETEAALQRLKALESIENEVKSVNKPKAVQAKGQTLSKGNQLKGLAKLEHDQYISDLESHIKSNWVLPEWMAKSAYKCILRAKFNFRGFVTEVGVVESSGDSQFDQYAIKAVEASNPFPVPPDDLKDLFNARGVTLSFP